MALNTRIGPTAVAAALGLAALAGAGSAKAITCAEVAESAPGALKEHVIYGAGGSAITATLAKVALTLSKADPPILVFYADPGAEQGYNYFRDGNGAGKAGTSEFKYWLKDADLSAAPKCTAVDTLAGQATDFATIGSSLALFGQTLPADTLQFFGPAQGVNIIVPKNSPETSISAEALYFVYGFGDATQYGDATAPVPWTNKAYIIQRKSTSFVQQFIRGAIQQLGGAAATFPPSFPGATVTEACSSAGDTNGGTVNCVEAAASAGHAEQGIGFTSGPTADGARARVHTLAYQHVGQTAGYWPDSTPDSFDKRNIRSGQYYLWDVNQFFVKTAGSNANPTLDKITNADLRKFIGYFSGQLTPPADADVNRAISETGSIPLCAMHAQRSSDFGGLSCYAPSEPCDCYFESIATGTTSCDACTTDAQCGDAAPKCHFGFCEAY